MTTNEPIAMQTSSLPTWSQGGGFKTFCGGLRLIYDLNTTNKRDDLMKSFFLVLNFVFFIPCSIAEVPVGNLAKRGDLTYEINSQTPFSGVASSYYANGKLESKYKYKNGRFHGRWKMYRPDGQLGISAKYKDGRKEGLYQDYYENGQVRQEKHYKGGKAEGLYKDYYENGQLRLKENYKDGVLEGLWEVFYENGHLRQTRNYYNGQLVFRENYKDKKVEGLWERYYKNGQLDFPDFTRHLLA